MEKEYNIKINLYLLKKLEKRFEELNTGLPSNVKDLSKEQLAKIVSFLFTKISKETDSQKKNSYLDQLDQIRSLTDAFNDEIVDIIIDYYWWISGKEAKILADLIMYDSLYKVVEKEILYVMNEVSMNGKLDYFENTDELFYKIGGRAFNNSLSHEEDLEIQQQTIRIFEKYGEEITSSDSYIVCLSELIYPIRLYNIKELYSYYKPVLERIFNKEWNNEDRWEYDEEFDESILNIIGFNATLLLKEFATKEDLPILEKAYKTPNHSTALNILKILARIGGTKAKKIIKGVSTGDVSWSSDPNQPHMEYEAEKLLKDM